MKLLCHADVADLDRLMVFEGLTGFLVELFVENPVAVGVGVGVGSGVGTEDGAVTHDPGTRWSTVVARTLFQSSRSVEDSWRHSEPTVTSHKPTCRY